MRESVTPKSGREERSFFSEAVCQLSQLVLGQRSRAEYIQETLKDLSGIGWEPSDSTVFPGFKTVLTTMPSQVNRLRQSIHRTLQNSGVPSFTSQSYVVNRDAGHGQKVVSGDYFRPETPVVLALTVGWRHGPRSEESTANCPYDGADRPLLKVDIDIAESIGRVVRRYHKANECV
jgi:hypothetical protein